MTSTRTARVPAAPEIGYVCTCPRPHRQPGPDAEEVDLYRRISIDKRIGGVEELAIERQTEEVCKMCGEMNKRIVRVWTDNDLSATSGVYRPAFEGILLHPQAKVVVTWHTDRFVRLTKELERVIERGVTIHAVKAGAHDLSSVTGQATAKTQTTWAQHEVELKAERQRSQNRQSALRGRPRWWGRTPFGYNKDGSQNPEQARALKAAYEALLMGATVASQVRYLNNKGLVSNTGARWQHGSLRHVLLNPRNAGIRTYTTVVNKGTPRAEKVTEEIGRGDWEPIVSEETYRAVVHILNDSKRLSGGPRTGKEPLYLLTSFARCGKCGSTVNVRRRGGKGVPEEKRYAYYSCRAKQCISHRVYETDSIVLTRVIELLQDERFRSAWRVSESVDVQPLIMEKAALEQSKKELTELLVDKMIDREQLIAGTEKANRRISEINALLAQAGSQESIADLVADEEPMWEQFEEWLANPREGDNLENARRRVQAVCQSITLLPRNNSPKISRDLIVIEPRLPERMSA